MIKFARFEHLMQLMRRVGLVPPRTARASAAARARSSSEAPSRAVRGARYRVNPSANHDLDDTSSLLQSRRVSKARAAVAFRLTAQRAAAVASASREHGDLVT